MTFDFEGISKWSPTGGQILESVSLHLERSELTALLGANGCGKTTLAKIMAGIDPDFQGGRFGVAPGEVAFVPQDYRASLLPWCNGEQNILFPLKLQRVERALGKERFERVVELLPIGPLLARRTWELSGGQCQLLCIARALIARPKVFILDEPFSALDVVLSNELGELLRKLVSTQELSVLMISHNIDHALEISDQVVVMGSNPGRVLETFRRSRGAALGREKAHPLPSGRELLELIALDRIRRAAEERAFFKDHGQTLRGETTR